MITDHNLSYGIFSFCYSSFYQKVVQRGRRSSPKAHVILSQYHGYYSLLVGGGFTEFSEKLTIKTLKFIKYFIPNISSSIELVFFVTFPCLITGCHPMAELRSIILRNTMLRNITLRYIT